MAAIRNTHLSRAAEAAGQWLWTVLWDSPFIGIPIWIGIGFELFGISFSFKGLQGPVDSVLIWFSEYWSLGALCLLGLPFLLVRTAAVHLLATQTRLSRSTGEIFAAPASSAVHRGRFVLLSVLLAGLDATVLHLLAETQTTPSGCGEVVLSGSGLPLRIALCLVLLLAQFLLVAGTVWVLNGPLVKWLTDRVPATIPLVASRDPGLRLRHTAAFDGFVYGPIIIAALLTTPRSGVAVAAVMSFLIVKMAFASAAEAVSVLMDWWNGRWIQRLGPKLVHRKDPAARIAAIEDMAKFAEVAGPVWPELPEALREAETLGALSGQLMKLSVQYVFSLTERDWTTAIGVGEVILQWYPNSGMARLVNDRMESLQERIGSPLQPSIGG